MPQEPSRLYLPDVARLAGMSVPAVAHRLAVARARRLAQARGVPWRPRPGDDLPLPSGREAGTGKPLYWGDPGVVRAWAARERRAAAERRAARRLYVEDVARLLGVTPATVHAYRVRAAQRARADADGRLFAHQPGDDLPAPDGKDPRGGGPHRLWWSYETLAPYLASRRGPGRPRAGGPARPADLAAARQALTRAASEHPGLPWPDLVRHAAGYGVPEEDIAALYSRPVGMLYTAPPPAGD